MLVRQYFLPWDHKYVLVRQINRSYIFSKFFFQTFVKHCIYAPQCTFAIHFGCYLQWYDLQIPAILFLIWFCISDRPWSWTRYHQSIAESFTSTPSELKDEVYHCIYILYFFSTVLIERIYLPGVVLNPGIHHWESSDLSTAPQRLKKNVYLCIYISYFCTCLVLGRWNLTPMQVRIPLSPHTTLNTIQLLQLLCLLTTPLGVANQQICKLQTASSDLFIYTQCLLIGFCSL